MPVYRSIKMAGKNRVLVVDDEPFNREIMQELLEPEFEVSYVASGQECLDLAPQWQPGIILLDISMPGMSGYEVCKKLKNEALTKDIPVTFVSALDTLGERLAGYEVGGDDYITKPFEGQEILTRINVALRNRQAQQALKESADMAMSTAMTAIHSTGELGVVLQFLGASFGCDDYESLAQLAVDAMLSYGLRSTVQIRTSNSTINKCSEYAINPLEVTVIKRLCNEDRIIDIGTRTIINYERISVLIKGMPTDDSDRYGRIKDNVALLVEGADARIKAINMQMNLERQRKGLAKMVQNTQKSLEAIGVKYENNKIKSMRILADLVANVEKSFAWLGLSEDQEVEFMRMVNASVHATIDLYHDGIEIDKSMVNLMDEVNDIMDGFDV